MDNVKLEGLYEMQRELDRHINEKKGIVAGSKVNEKMLALLVEVGECANEWRGFKFWSEDQETRERVLEEYVDGIHFALSIGLDLGAENEELRREPRVREVVEAFSSVYVQAGNLMLSTHLELKGKTMIIDYQDLLYTIFDLGASLGFTWEQVVEAYFAKNEVNHERQENGY